MILLIFVISLIAWAISLTIILAVFFMPVRAVIAYLRAPFSRKHWQQFRHNRTENYGDSIRYRLGLYAPLVALGLSIALIFIVLILAFGFWASDTFFKNSPASILKDIGYWLGYSYAVLIFLAVAVPFFVTPFTYIYEYYFVKRNKRDWITYSIVFIFALSLPVWGAIPLFYKWSNLAPKPVAIVFANNKTPIYGTPKDLDEHVQRIKKEGKYTYRLMYDANNAPFKIESVSSPCNKVLSNLTLRFPVNTNASYNDKFFFNNERVISEEAFGLFAYSLTFDQFLQSGTFGASESFGCKFSDIDIDYDHFTYSIYMAVFNLIASVFSISIFLSPVKTISYFVYARFRLFTFKYSSFFSRDNSRKL